MFGNNPKRPPEKGDGIKLDVQEIFKTFQGEGPRAGTPAIFLRLGGCNLACQFCDTEFESFKNQTLDYILKTIQELSTNNYTRTHKMVVITGGEPFRQPIEELCNRLIEASFIVQIETNGTLYREVNKNVEIICSPKNNGKEYGKIRPDLLQRINAFKFILSAHNTDYGNVGDVGQDAFNIPIYVQPMDEYDAKKNADNMVYTVKYAEEFGYNLSLQIHKIADFQ